MDLAVKLQMCFCLPSGSLQTRPTHAYVLRPSLFVLQDRVMINRMDNICEAVIKGKWPSNRRQFFDFPGLLPGYSTMATDSPLPRRGLGDLSMVSQTSYSGSEDLTMSPQVNKASHLPCPQISCFLRLSYVSIVSTRLTMYRMHCKPHHSRK